MRFNFFGDGSLLQAIFAEAEKARLNVRLPKSVDVTKAEYAVLLAETGQPALTNVFGIPVTVDGEEAPNPVALFLANLEKEAAVLGNPNSVN